MTMPNDVRSAAGLPPGSRASDYASSKYYLPPPVPADGDLTVDVTGPGDAAAYAPPLVPAAAPRRRRANPVLGVALVLVLLAGVLGGGYWMLNRHADSAGAASVGHKPAAITDVGTANGMAATAKATGSYLFRPARRHFVVRLPHRPATRTISLSFAGLSGSALLMLDSDAKAAVEWVRINSGIPVSEQQPFLRGAVTGIDRSSAFTLTSARSVTFHGRPARLASLKARNGTAYTALVVIYRPTHALVVLAPTGRTYNLIAGSFAWPV